MTRAFTLVELLVVITIVVVLLALLAPALDKAIYEAELAVCGAKLHANHGGIVGYALSHRRWYPNRKVFGHISDVDPVKITAVDQVMDYDDRVQLKGYIAVGKTMLCPLQPVIDLEVDSARDTWVYTGYAAWWGWRFAPQGIPRKGMYKLGDRLEFDLDPGPGSDIRSSGVLAADHLSTTPMPGARFFYSTHPEKRELHNPWRLQRGPHPWAGTGSEYTSNAVGFMTLSWFANIWAPGAAFDVDYLMGDGSVALVRNFRIGHGPEKGLVAMPTFGREWDNTSEVVNPVPAQ